eukprot:c11343_g1_i1 orf=520-3471(+)
MSRREISIRERDSHRDGRPDTGKSVRHPLHPPPLQRERIRGDSPRSHRMRSVSPPRLHRDRFPRDSRGRNVHREPSPRRRASRSPIRGSRHRVDGDFHSFRARSPDGYRRRSLEPPARQDSSRERRMRSPRMAARTPPPPPPPRSPRLPMRPVSPRFSMRPASPRVHTRLASPRASLRPVSPRLAMRPVSPQALICPFSPQGVLRGSRMPMSGSSPPAVAFSRELNRHAHEAMLASSRNGPILALQSGTSLGPGSTDVHKNQEDESLSSSGMLVPRSIVLEDGTVGTFYSLPPDPLLNTIPATVENGLGGKMLPPFPDGLTQYSTEPTGLRYAGIPVERDYFSAQDQRLSDRTLPSQNQYAAGDRGLPEYSSYHRDRPLSPHQNAFDRPLQSRSPLRSNRDGVVNTSSREGYASEMERTSRRVNYDKRESAFSTDISLRDGFSSPPKRRSEEDYRKSSDKDMIGYGRDLKHDEFLRISEEGRMTTHRYAPLAYDPPRQRGLVRSPEPRDSSRFEPRDANFHRQTRTPPREALRHDDDYPQRHSAYRSDTRKYSSPPDRNTRMRLLTPPDVRKNFSYEEERGAWKRKFIEMGGDPFPDQRNGRLHESEFKRREIDGNMHHNDNFRDRRPSGWDRKDGWLERREDMLGRLGRRPIRERSRSPQLSRRYPDIDKRQNGSSVKEQAGRLNVDKVTPSQREIQDRDEKQLAPDLPEDSAEFKQQVQRAFLKYAKILNEDSNQRKKYEEQGKAGTLVCLACGRLSKPFVDTHSLVMHALQSKKRGLRADHLGLCKAICSVMGWNQAIDPAGGKLYQNISVEEAKANKEDLILWPPAVVVHNVFVRKITEGQQEGAAESAVKKLLKDAGLSFERIKIAVGRQGSTVIIKYLPILSCLHDAEHLHKHFASSNRCRDDWLRVEPAKQETSAENGLAPEDNRGGKTSMLYGYLALAQDLEKVDLDLQRRCQIKSRKDIEAIAGDSLALKKAAD